MKILFRVCITIVFLGASVCLHGATVSLGSAVNYTVLGLPGANFNFSAGTVSGNVGLSKNGSLTDNANVNITGNLVVYSSAEVSGSGPVGGSTIVNPSALNQADADVQTALTEIAGLTATQTFGTLTNANTINGNGGLNVIDINGNIGSNNTNTALTLNGSASDYFVVVVTGNVNIQGNGTVGLLLSGGVTANHVIYDFTSSSGSFTVGTRVADFYGTLLGPNMSFNLDGPKSPASNFFGEVIGGNVFLNSFPYITADTFSGYGSSTPPPSDVTPEPGSLLLMGTGLCAVAGAIRRRNQTHSRARFGRCRTRTT